MNSKNLAMNPKDERFLKFIQSFGDGLAATTIWFLAYSIRFYALPHSLKEIPSIDLYGKAAFFIFIIWTWISLVSSSSKEKDYESILKNTGMGTLLIIAFAYFYDSNRLYSRLVIGIFATLQILPTLWVRRALRKLFPEKKRNVLLIGDWKVLEKVSKDQNLEGWIPFEENPSDPVRLPKANITIFQQPQRPEEWAEFFAKNPSINTVFLALPYEHYPWLSVHLDAIAEQLPDVRWFFDLSKWAGFANVEMHGQCPVILFHDTPLQGEKFFLKRIIDILGAILGLVLMAPLMAVCALLIKWFSPGPVFYTQMRMSLDGEEFQIYKFRSMHLSAEEGTGAVWASAEDDRCHPVGRWLRKTSLDELPQLYNVLKGEMSLVGPRPERRIFVDQFRKKIPRYMLRHKVKAGMTGWAQIHGWRGNSSLENRIACDLYYIQNWSFMLDLKILFLTPWKGFINQNAY